MSAAIQTEDLTKVYPAPRRGEERVAVNGLTLQIAESQVFAFLGPNGAGKTTTIKMLLGFIRPTRGRAQIFGCDVAQHEVRRQVGYLPEQPYFHNFLSPRETLSVHACLLGLGKKERLERIEYALYAVGLEGYQGMRVSKLSKGLMQRVGIAQALVGKPRLLILDEPTSGLDPIGRREMKNLITSLKATGVTIFLSSHLLSEVEEICDRVAILSRGTLVCEGPPDEIKQSRDIMNIRCSGVSDEIVRDLLRVGADFAQDGAIEAVKQSGQVAFQVASEHVFDAIRVLESHNAPLLSVSPQQETLEDAFLRLAA